MNNSQEPLLLDHEADGIRELDNQLPRWWLWLFILTIAFSAVYLLYYHVLDAGDLMVAEYEKEMHAGEARKSAALARFETGLGQLQPSNDAAVLDTGQRLFSNLCAPCHRPDGGGLVGPNLTDDYWIHGAAFADNLRVIWHGVPEKGMVSWKTLLKPADVLAVASYIYTLRGTSPPNPKPPENMAPAEEKPSEFE